MALARLARFAALLSALGVGGDRVALAQTAPAGAPGEAADPPQAPPEDVHPPELVEFSEAAYPPEAAAARRQGRVVLRLTIDAEGRVSDAEIAEAAGAGFDDAARAAALRFRFTPARRGNTPVPARILYTYEFRLPPAKGAASGESPPPTPRATPAPPESSGAPTDGAATDGAPTEVPAQASSGAPREGPSAAPAEAPIDVTVQGASDADRARQSAQAVHVIEIERARRESADLGEVMARSEGVGVRRGGGLGSETRFSLNGLTDDQIRFFLDGVPLELAGYPFGIANVPVNLVERVEIHRGVMPIALGADALGGGVNLVTDDSVRGTRGTASYQVGSFGTQRLTLGAQTLHPRSGMFARASAFYDYADNDYAVDVEVPDDRGQLSAARAYRFHDGYRAAGGNVEAGLVDRSWAKRLLLRAFFTDYSKELQHNAVMTVPYGEVEYGERASGASLRFEHALANKVALRLLAGATSGRLTFRDVGECIYNWFGQCTRERPQPGEIEAHPRDQVLRARGGFARLNAGWQIDPRHAVRLSLSPTYATRTGDERRQADPGARDPLSAQRDLYTLVSGVEHELDALGDRLENIAFVKDYVQVARSEEPRPGGTFRRSDRNTHRFGVGNALRYRVAPWLYAKASYEWVTRLPRPDEVFGDGALIIANLELVPETSHNANLGVTLDARHARTGAWRADVNGFVRDADRLIVLLGNDRVFGYQNVFGARSLGVEAAAGWTSPAEHLALDGNITYVDLRNTSSEGTFGDFEGDRIPNRPYLFANGSLRTQLRRVAAPDDEIALSWTTRYVHSFFRGWESVGLRDSKQVVPSQLLHALALSYLVRGASVALSFTGEVQNLGDEPSFDFFGVQRPGRAFYFKSTAEF